MLPVLFSQECIDDEGNTPLDMARLGGHTQVAALLGGE